MFLKTFYWHDILHSDSVSRNEEKSARTNWSSAAGDRSLVVTSRRKALFSFGISSFKTIYRYRRRRWHGDTMTLTRPPATVCQAEPRHTEPLWEHAASLPRPLDTPAGLNPVPLCNILKRPDTFSSACTPLIQSKARGEVIQKCRHGFSEVTPTRGQCTQFLGGCVGGLGIVGGLPEKI